jgi:integral membrane protein (TIGR01906 family)
MKNVSWFSKISSWLVSILTPFVILMISIRILISPLFAQIEYQLPGFPEDPYGFTFEDRLRWSEPSIKYLVNSEGIGYLESLRFENGEPIYNPSELSHMEDVKAVVTGMRIALAALTVILLIFTMININKGNKHLILQSFHNGGWGILGLIGAIMILLVISFNQLFTWFHQIFFESGTWRFYTSDTLIRLFPMRFWRDAFIFVGVLCILFGVITILVTRKYINLEKSK